MVTTLPDAVATALKAAPFTYADVGATSAAMPAVMPAGYASFTTSRQLRRRDFTAAADELLTWRVQERAGLGVEASSLRVTEGTVARITLGKGPVRVLAPCRVVYVIDEPDRAGFAYGTLPGHPESGEELFLLGHRADGSVEFTVTAFSRPATLLSRVGGPAARWVQRLMTNRYLTALDS
jgi:uncharacterized protein (UPF0548 family)